MRKIRALVALTTSLVLFTACAEDGNHASNADNAINNGSADGSNNGSGDDGNDGGNDGGANNGSNNGGDDGGGDDGGANNGANNGGNTDAALAQYTPDQANWDTFATKPVEGGNPAHDPDSVSWIKAADWADAEWDGTIYNPSKMSRAELAKAICPSGDRVRGLRKVFYDNKPFADNANPTKAEVDEWHRLAINHVRALVGYTSPERQVKKDHCMFARALWGDERKFTTKWDDKYPGTNGSAFGPCQGSSNAHCGATFIPSLEDQAPYLPAGHPGCSAEPGAEGIFSAPKSNIPWAIKWSRALCSTLGAEGFWGGHTGPWFHRERFGLSFWDPDLSNNNNNAPLRAKWSGRLMPNLYCDPAEPTCDPEATGP